MAPEKHREVKKELWLVMDEEDNWRAQISIALEKYVTSMMGGAGDGGLIYTAEKFMPAEGMIPDLKDESG